MPQRKHLSLEQKEMIIQFFNNGMTQKFISVQFGINKSIVSRLIKKYREEHFFARKPGSGRRRKTTKQIDKRILREESKRNPFLTSKDIKINLQLNNITTKTIQRRLIEGELFGGKPAKKPLISKKNRKLRIEFARRHLNKTSSQWRNVLFSDETKINMINSDGIQWVRRPHNKRFNPKYTTKTIKHHGGSIMLWGCFSFYGMGPLHWVKVVMTGIIYRNIFETVMLPYAEDEMPLRHVFQQDNDPKHRSKIVTRWFEDNGVSVMEWPSQSPDLNPIEHVWQDIKIKLHDKKFKNTSELFEEVKRLWESFPQDKILKLLDSMPKRCQAVINSKGYPTKY